ncbi:YcgL domain-containing protein [Luteimonas sp. A277]
MSPPSSVLAMHAYVYKSLRKADTYVYLARRDDFECLPAPLRERLGKLHFVLHVELTPERKLASQDPEQVRSNLVARGFHLQVPPSTADDPMTEDWGTDA